MRFGCGKHGVVFFVYLVVFSLSVDFLGCDPNVLNQNVYEEIQPANETIVSDDANNFDTIEGLRNSGVQCVDRQLDCDGDQVTETQDKLQGSEKICRIQQDVKVPVKQLEKSNEEQKQPVEQICVQENLSTCKQASQVEKQDEGQQVEVVLIDLDDTLYWSPEFSQLVDKNVLNYLKNWLHIPDKEALDIVSNGYRQHGTTMAALVNFGYKVNIPHFYEQVFQLPYRQLLHVDESILNTIRDIKLPKFIFTNGNYKYAVDVLAALGFKADDFQGIISIESLMGQYLDLDGYIDDQYKEFICKPKPEAFKIAIEVVRQQLNLWQLHPRQVVLIDDGKRNIKTANSLGMKTILVNQKDSDHPPPNMEAISIQQLKDKEPVLFI
eukprot:TRINITY_DN36711_c1_g1_i5.p2 TRINITY_DN36711_c1_g1~~TRINITY_DN36711_c1_g1_i5.p2  ORF type:complete len:381 (-),score=36.23 TRINITY_DN36711_c1_g1_i5:966-2108(-)